MIKAIIFDCFKTLFYTDVDIFPFKEFADTIEEGIFSNNYMKNFEKHFMLNEFETYKEPTENFLDNLGVEKQEDLVFRLENILNNGVKNLKPYEETLGVLNSLKKQYKLGLISNTDSIAFEFLVKKYNMNELFNVLLPSYDVGVLKPDEFVFKIMLEKLKVNSNEVIMVGDSLEDDIKAAESTGISGVLVDREEKHKEYEKRITSLNQVSNYL